MSNILDRQTYVISVNMATFSEAANPPVKSIVNIPINLRFTTHEMVLKSIVYNNPFFATSQDLSDIIQIYCNITNDNLIGAFSNAPAAAAAAPPGIVLEMDNHFTIGNPFQTSNMQLQFMQTTNNNLNNGNVAIIGNAGPQLLISRQAVDTAQRTFGTVVLTIEFLKLK